MPDYSTTVLQYYEYGRSKGDLLCVAVHGRRPSSTLLRMPENRRRDVRRPHNNMAGKLGPRGRFETFHTIRLGHE
jgi:hypothetical protein